MLLLRLLDDSDAYDKEWGQTLPILRVHGEFGWEDPRKGATNMAKRINKKLSENAEAWCVIPEDNERCLFVLNSELGRRS